MLRCANRLMPVAMVLCLGGVGAAVSAQSVAPKPRAEMTAAERAQRDADKVFAWIKVHADKEQAKAVAAPSAQPVTAQVHSTGVAKPTPKQEPRALASRQTVAEQPELPTQAEVAEVKPEVEPPLLVAALAPKSSAMPNLALEAPSAGVAKSTPSPVAEAALVFLEKVAPEFPRKLMDSLQRGSVMVRFTVLPDGTVGRAEALQTSNRRLSAIALEAVAKWRFAPIAQPREASVELGFNLD